MRLLGLLLCFAFFGCSSKQTVKSQNTNLTFLYSSNRYLDMEPCGCSLNPLGGIAREWNYLQEVQKTAKHPLYFISGTSFVPEETRFERKNKSYYTAKADYLLEAFQAFNVSAIAPSAEDLFLGSSELQALARKHGLAFVSLNLLDKQSKKPLFAPYLEMEHDGMPLLILGLSSKPHPKFPANPAIAIRPPEQALADFFAKNNPSGRLVILLANLDHAEKTRIAQAYPQIHFILGGSNDEVPGSLDQYSGTTVYLNPQGNGKSVYRVDAEIHLPIEHFYNAEMAQAHKDTREIWAARIREKEAQMKTASGKARKDLLTEITGMQSFLKRSSTVPTVPGKNTSKYVFARTELGTAYEKGSNPMHALVDRLKDAIREIALEKR